MAEGIRQRILSKMSEIGMTQRELASAIESSPQEVNAFLRGRQVISFAKLERIFEVLGL